MIQKILQGPNSLSDPFGSARRAAGELMVEVGLLTYRGLCLECKYLTCSFEESSDVQRASKAETHKSRHDLPYLFASLIATFPLTADQKAIPYASTLRHLAHQIDWNSGCVYGQGPVCPRS
jgi:hypothetical protein